MEQVQGVVLRAGVTSVVDQNVDATAADSLMDGVEVGNVERQWLRHGTRLPDLARH